MAKFEDNQYNACLEVAKTYVDMLKQLTDTNIALSCNHSYMEEMEKLRIRKEIQASMSTFINRICENMLSKDQMAKLNEHFNDEIPTHCPNKGEFIAYKAAESIRTSDWPKSRIVILKIPEDARRSSAFGNKCRCDKATVIKIYNPETKRPVKKARSFYDESFIYTVGETVSVDNFDTNRWNECSTGIHFYMSEREAINHIHC